MTNKQIIENGIYSLFHQTHSNYALTLVEKSADDEVFVGFKEWKKDDHQLFYILFQFDITN